jgi:hypothetical protein
MSNRDNIHITADITPRLSVELSKQEAWQLYVLLADDAPFVRHALSVVRRTDGGGTVSLSTPRERQHVLDALLRALTTADRLTSGLDALTTALKATRQQLNAPSASDV